MQEVGRLTLNKNPQNKFNDDMQLGFSPARIVPGALGNLLTSMCVPNKRDGAGTRRCPVGLRSSCCAGMGFSDDRLLQSRYAYSSMVETVPI